MGTDVGEVVDIVVETYGGFFLFQKFSSPSEVRSKVTN